MCQHLTPESAGLSVSLRRFVRVWLLRSTMDIDSHPGNGILSDIRWNSFPVDLLIDVASPDLLSCSARRTLSLNGLESNSLDYIRTRPESFYLCRRFSVFNYYDCDRLLVSPHTSSCSPECCICRFSLQRDSRLPGEDVYIDVGVRHCEWMGLVGGG